MSDGTKRLIVCFDGTWNTPEDSTNVIRLFQAVADEQSGAEEQLKFYDMGVGTDTETRLRGGLFGAGLGENIRQGYAWLCRNYAPLSASVDAEGFVDGPDIYLFGFSRGAFTARSLGGLIARCGLVRAGLLRGAKIDKATRWKPGRFDREQRDDPRVAEAWRLYRQDLAQGRDDPSVVSFRRANCHNVRIKMIGVWDTVGALGVPTISTVTQPIRRQRYSFHDLSLSPLVENAYHAMAIDEHRADFNIALWDSFDPQHTRDIEQRWFPGAHANVGGGYEDDNLADISLNWMIGKAAGLGLRLQQQPWTDLRSAGPPAAKNEIPSYLSLRGDEFADPVRDSYAEFAYGFYHRVPLVKRLYRPMLTMGVRETIDPSALAKWNSDPGYRPYNLALAGSERKNRDSVEAVAGD
ncbi:DUF2235 domain-containing protein [Dongia sp.]|uniref:DUF2235 domain-containing protein n=1 Tax=Dongia sp. TaxID=1977262 RepID=UPI0035B27B23